jgi:hypothetical protein
MKKLIIVMLLPLVVSCGSRDSAPASHTSDQDPVGPPISFVKEIEFEPGVLLARFSVSETQNLVRVEFLSPNSLEPSPVAFDRGHIVWPAKRGDPHTLSLLPEKTSPAGVLSVRANQVGSSTAFKTLPRGEKPRISIRCTLGGKLYSCRLHWRGDVYWFDRGTELK